MATGRLHGKVALITGSDSGIGQAAATEFAREGADVVVHYLHDAEGAAQTRKGVEAAGRRAVVIQADISVEEQVESMFDEAVQAFGTLDVLVNNAGVDASGKPVAELPTEVWDRALRTNVYGTFFCCRRFVRLRTASGGQGKIINVTSVHEDIPNAGQGEPQSRSCWSRAVFKGGVQAEDGQEQVRVVFDLPEGGGDLGMAGLADQPECQVT
jgi:glucose 1-dehydrogenase